MSAPEEGAHSPLWLLIKPRQRAGEVNESPQAVTTLALSLVGGLLLAACALRAAGAGERLGALDLLFAMVLLAPLMGYAALALASRLAALSAPVSATALHTQIAWAALPAMVVALAFAAPHLSRGWFGAATPAFGGGTPGVSGALVLLLAVAWGVVTLSLACAARAACGVGSAALPVAIALGVLGIVYYLVVLTLMSLL